MDGGEYVSIVPVVYPRGTVNVSSLGSFSSIGSSSIPSHTSFSVSLRAHHIQYYFNIKRRSKIKFIKPQQYKAIHEEQMKQSKVIL